MTVSFNERTLILENYGAPLRVITLDEGVCDVNSNKTLSSAFSIPMKKVMPFEKWKDIRNTIIKRLSAPGVEGLYRNMLEDEGEDVSSSMVESFIVSKKKFIEWSSEFEDIDYFCNNFVMRSMFLSSEGSIKNTYNDAPMLPFDLDVGDYIFNTLVSGDDRELDPEEYAYWLKISSFLLEPITTNFKDDFKELHKYEIPYGLSPKTEKSTLEDILSKAKHASIIPIVQGGVEIGNAITAHEWVLAIEAAAASGATVIILVGTVKVAEIVYKWQRNK